MKILKPVATIGLSTMFALGLSHACRSDDVVSQPIPEQTQQRSNLQMFLDFLDEYNDSDSEQ